MTSADAMPQKRARLYEEAERGCYDIQQQIFAVADITPEDITDAAVAPLIEELWEYALA